MYVYSFQMPTKLLGYKYLLFGPKYLINEPLGVSFGLGTP